jgi:glycosyltransferase involved in cell wall biosynthesis
MSHIAMLIPTIDQIGGAERQVLLLAKALATRGWRVSLIALSGSGPEPQEAAALTNANVSYLSLEMRKAWIDPRGWARYRNWHRANKPHIVHSHLPHATWFARCARLLAPTRVVIDTIHTSATGGKAWQLTYRLTQPFTTHVTCVSYAVASSVLRSRIADRNKLSVVPNGVELPPIASRKNRQPHTFHWIAIGRLSPVKDYPTLLRAIAHLPRHTQLTIAGSGPGEQSLKQLALELNIEQQIHFAGFQNEIQPLLEPADAFVLTSLWEGLPMGVLEAQAAGLPVVATNGAGTREALVDNKTGLLVPIGDAASVASAMTRIMTMSLTDRLAMGAAGRQFIEKHFELSVITDTWEKLYRGLLQTHPNRSRRG